MSFVHGLFQSHEECSSRVHHIWWSEKFFREEICMLRSCSQREIVVRGWRKWTTPSWQNWRVHIASGKPDVPVKYKGFLPWTQRSLRSMNCNLRITSWGFKIQTVHIWLKNFCLNFSFLRICRQTTTFLTITGHILKPGFQASHPAFSGHQRKKTSNTTTLKQ